MYVVRQASIDVEGTFNVTNNAIGIKTQGAAGTTFSIKGGQPQVALAEVTQQFQIQSSFNATQDFLPQQPPGLGAGKNPPVVNTQPQAAVWIKKGLLTLGGERTLGTRVQLGDGNDWLGGLILNVSDTGKACSAIYKWNKGTVFSGVGIIFVMGTGVKTDKSVDRQAAEVDIADNVNMTFDTNVRLYVSGGMIMGPGSITIASGRSTIEGGPWQTAEGYGVWCRECGVSCRHSASEGSASEESATSVCSCGQGDRID